MQLIGCCFVAEAHLCFGAGYWYCSVLPTGLAHAGHQPLLHAAGVV